MTAMPIPRRRLTVAALLFVAFGPFASLANLSGDEPPKVEQLIKELENADAFVRLKAAKQLGELGLDAKEAIPALKKALADEDGDVRVIAERALKAINEAVDQADVAEAQKKFNPLRRKLRSKKYAERKEAVEEFAAMGEVAAPVVGEIVQFGLDTPSTTLRNASGEAIRKIVPDLAEHIITIVVDQNPSNKTNAVEALRAKRELATPALPILKMHLALEKARFLKLPGALNYPDGVLDAMAEIKPSDEDLVQEVLALVASRTSLARLTGIKLLSRIEVDNDSRVKALISALNDRRYWIYTINALGALGKDAKGAIPALEELKFDSSEPVRKAVPAALAKIEGG